MIQVSHLSKRYGDLTAVDDLSFTFGDGHVYGLLGPNGAGKSTTMNIMTGCLSPTEGTVRIGGFDILEEPRKAKRLLGWEAKYNLDDMCAHSWNWQKNNPKGYDD